MRCYNGERGPMVPLKKIEIDPQLQGVPKKRRISEYYSICFTTHLILNLEDLSKIHLKVDIRMFIVNTIPYLRDISELRNISFII